MGFISFEELMGKISQVQKEMEKEKAEKEALGIHEPDENTESGKGVEIGIDTVKNRRLVIRNNTLCFEPLSSEGAKNSFSSSDCQKNGSVHSNSYYQGIKCNENGKSFGHSSGYENGRSFGNLDFEKNVQANENSQQNANPKVETSALEKFAEFWEAYPKKYNIDQARRTFLNLNPDDELHKKILSAINNAKKSYSWRNQNGRFIPFPAKWLRNHCWEEFGYDFYG